MGLLEFDKLPINTLVGADWKTFKAVTANKTIDKGFRNKYFLTNPFAACSACCNPSKMRVTVRLRTSRWRWTRCSFSDIGAAGRLSCTMSSRVTSISATIRPIRPYFRT